MKGLLTIIIFFIFSFSHWSMAGGGWPQNKGSGFSKINQYMIISDKYYTPGGDIVDITTTGYYSSSVYAEYGITDRLTAIAYVPFFVRSTLNRLVLPNGTVIEGGDALNSFGDTDLTFKYGLIKNGPVVMAASVTLGLPLGVSSGGETRLLQSGDGEFNQMFTLEVSSSNPKGNLYGTLTGSINNRTNHFSEEFRYGLELGYKLSKFWLINRLMGIKSFNNGNDDFILNNGIFNNNMEYLTVSPEILYEMNDSFGLAFSAGFALYGKKILASPSYSLGIFYKW